MSASRYATIPQPTPEQRKVAVQNYERAKQVIANRQFDYAIELLLISCKIDPASVSFRTMLRKVQKEKYGNNLRGSPFGFLSMPRLKTRLKAAKAGGDYLKVLEYGEQALCKNPWDLGTQMDMAEAFDALGLVTPAVHVLDQARQKFPKDPTLNRALARLFEKQGDFQKAIALWGLVKEANPQDVEAAHKAKDLAASETIARGNYEEAVSGSKPSVVLDKITEMNADRADKAERDTAALLKRIEADPTEPSLYAQLATIYRKSGQHDRARAALQQGMGPTGGHFSLQTELLELDLIPVKKNLETTEAKIRKAKAKPADADDDDENEMSVTDLERLRDRLRKEINAREVDLYRARADRFPSDLSHRLELGIRLLRADNLDEAISELQQARRDDRLKGKAGMHLGYCFKKRNNWRLAQRNFEEALAALPKGDDANRKEVLFQLATGSAENGDIARAIDLGHELANLDFAYKNIGSLLDKWESNPQRA